MIDSLKRTKTGISKLDKALNGGIPYGNIVLLSGGAGTGKSTFALQFLINGAKVFGEKGLYISTEQSKEDLIKTANNFGWDIESLELSNKLKIAYFDVIETDNFLEKIYEIYTAFQPQRIVIDSLTTLSDSLLVSGLDRQKDYSLVRIAESVSPIPRSERIVSKNLLYHLMKRLRLFNATVLMTSELYEEEHKLSADGISEFICDGVMLMHYVGVGAVDFRSMQIRKMRYTDHEKEFLLYNISKEGINLEEDPLKK